MLHLYPEDGNSIGLKHPRQASKWAKEIDPTLAAPMARGHDGRDYFVNELAMACLHDGSREDIVPLVVVRWFQRNGCLLSKAHPVLMHNTGQPGEREYVVDARKDALVEVPLVSYLFCVEDLCRLEVQVQWGLPAPERVHGKSYISSHYSDIC